MGRQTRDGSTVDAIVGLRGDLHRGVTKDIPIAANPTSVFAAGSRLYKALRPPPFTFSNAPSRASNNPGKRLNQVWFNGEGWGSG